MVELGILAAVTVAMSFLVVVLTTRFREAVISSRVYKKAFAFHMNTFASIHNRAISKQKEELFLSMKATLENLKGDILEIGSGTGANFMYFPEGSCVIALDPNPHMETYLLENADKFPNITVKKVVTGFGEDMGEIEGNSVAIVVCTLTLCSVQDVEAVLREVRRVLKPDGCFYYLEHIVDNEGSCRRVCQKGFDRLWKYFSDGCSCARDSSKFIDDAGFATVFHEKFYASNLTVLAWIMRPHLMGYAIK